MTFSNTLCLSYLHWNRPPQCTRTSWASWRPVYQHTRWSCCHGDSDMDREWAWHWSEWLGQLEYRQRHDPGTRRRRRWREEWRGSPFPRRTLVISLFLSDITSVSSILSPPSTFHGPSQVAGSGRPVHWPNRQTWQTAQTFYLKISSNTYLSYSCLNQVWYIDKRGRDREEFRWRALM